MDQESVTRILIESSTTINEELTRALDDLVTSEAGPFLLIDIIFAKNEKNIQKAALTYLYKAIKAQYKYISEEATAQINDRLLSLLNEVSFDPENWPLIVDTTAYVYEHVPVEWSPLFDLLGAKISDEASHLFGLSILAAILPYVKSERAESTLQYFLEVDIAALTEENVAANVFGVQIYSRIFSIVSATVDIVSESQPHLERIVEILGMPENFTVEQFSLIWKSVNDLLSNCALPEEVVVEIATKGIEFSSNAENDFGVKTIIFDAIEVVVESLGSMLENIMNISMDLIETSIETNQTIDESEYSLFEKIFISFPHSDVFPIVQQCISEALESESVTRQAAGLCVFRVLITAAPDCAYKDISTIIEFLTQSIASEDEPILQEAACKVLQYFSDGFKSLNCHSPQFIEPLIQLLVSENSDLRTPAYAALTDILKNLDSIIEGLFRCIIVLLGLIG